MYSYRQIKKEFHYKYFQLGECRLDLAASDVIVHHCIVSRLDGVKLWL